MAHHSARRAAKFPLSEPPDSGRRPGDPWAADESSFAELAAIQLNARSTKMYDFYPAEWGPAKHDPESPTAQALATALVMRDSDSQRPDDN
ncbi:MAG TPA: hypothetical protein PKA04_01430 [Marmoricola sp.]|nr:hypothetical protein [Marmoricola sp.]HMY09156.1 hypothetical protein [Marmoricola sp.]